MSDFLSRYRTRLKLSATEKLEATITKVFQLIADDSKLKNNIIIIQARYQNLEQDSIKGIVAEPDRVLRTNQILNSLFDLIDNIQAADIQETEDVLLNNYLKKQQAQITDSKAAESKQDDPEELKADKLDASPIDGISAAAERISIASDNKSTKVNPKSAKDLEIFSEMHRSPLTFFPIIYRALRSLVVRNGKASLEMGQLMYDIEQQLPAMEQFKKGITDMEPILKKVRTDYDKKVYWLQFQQLSNKRTTLTMETISDIEKMNEELSQFIKMLREKGVLH